MTIPGEERPPIPASPADLTAAWFSTALGRERPGVSVESVELERLGGLSSVVHRARLQYARDSAPGPASVVLKLPLVQNIRRLAPLGSGYYREVLFYREVAPQIGSGVPAALWTDFDPDSGDYVLMLEDFPDHTARTDDEFADTEEVAALLEAIARVHAAWWGNGDLAAYPFLRTLPDFIARVEAQLPKALPRFLERFSGRMGPAELSAFEALPGRFRRAVEPLELAPRTLVHHDLSLRNALFATGAGAPQAVLIDWQLAQRNAGVRDVSYLIGTCVSPDWRGREERSLLGFYLERLEELGVSGYAFERLLEDYRRSVICDFGRMVMTGGQEAITLQIEVVIAHQLACRAGSARELDLGALL